MSTLQNTTHVPPRGRTRIAAIVVALGALVAIGVSVLTLALTGASSRNHAPVATHSVPIGTSAPLINSHGTSHAVLDPATGQMHGAPPTQATASDQGTSASLPAQHFYGLQP